MGRKLVHVYETIKDDQPTHLQCNMQRQICQCGEDIVCMAGVKYCQSPFTTAKLYQQMVPHSPSTEMWCHKHSIGSVLVLRTTVASSLNYDALNNEESADRPQLGKSC